MPDTHLAQRIRALEDQAALKKLVDTFSILADSKDIANQVLLFTEDATVNSLVGGKVVSALKGREQIGRAFGAYLAGFDVVYHLNGQQTVEIDEDKATGVSTCLVVLVGNENGKTIKNTSCVYYNDEYVRRGGKWLIAQRTSHFVSRSGEEL